jgi:hypothetical protein
MRLQFVADRMSEDSRRVALTKADRATPTGQELIALLTELTADGQVTLDEVTRLRQWLEVERPVYLSACAFLHEAIEDFSRDGEISEDELDRLAVAIERILPPDVRKAAAAARRERLLARREARREARAAQIEARERARPIHRADFVVVGIRFSEERRDACEQVDVGEAVTLEREPDNPHDANAILVFSSDDSELGYVPREYASEMAPLLDDGAEVRAQVKKLLDRGPQVTPVVTATLYRAGAMPVEPKPELPHRAAQDWPAPRTTVPDEPAPPQSGPWRAVVLVVAALALAWATAYLLGG